jgi:predicted DNA-binding protein
MNKIDEHDESSRLTVTVPKTFEDRIKALASKKRVSSAWIVREAILVYLLLLLRDHD